MQLTLPPCSASTLRPIILLAAALIAGGRIYAAEVATPPVTIVAFGDSTTAPRGSTEVYATILQAALRNVRVINAGVGGNTTELARKRFDSDVLAHQPQIAIVQFGINDAAVDVWKKPPATEPRVSLERYEANLRHFVRTLKDRNTAVILITANPLRWTPKLKEMYGKPPYNPEDADGFNGLLKRYSDAVWRIAREEGTDLIDVPPALEARAKKESSTVDSYLPDGMHPNDLGHRVVADLLRERILAIAAKRQLPIADGPR